MNIFHQLSGRHGEVILPLTAGHHHQPQSAVAAASAARVDPSGQHRLVELFWQDRFLPGLVSASAAAAAAAAAARHADHKNKLATSAVLQANVGAPGLGGNNALGTIGGLTAAVNNNNTSPLLVGASDSSRTATSSKVGNQTNSQDPQAINSRVFVGNLNTFQVTKNEIEKMFQPYGRIAGISMHKGYAFVQFTNPFDARSACIGEDGKNISGQILDVNMVAEPKPHQVGRKRQSVTKTGNDWESYYDSYCTPAVAAALSPAAAAASALAPRLVSPTKRPRLVLSTSSSPRSTPAASSAAQQTPGKSVQLGPKQAVALDQLKTYSSPDILICGNCREMFSDLTEMINHKKTYCKLRFACRCENTSTSRLNASFEDGSGTERMVCAHCKDGFKNAMDLMIHAQTAHSANIYQEEDLNGRDDNQLPLDDSERVLEGCQPDYSRSSSGGDSPSSTPEGGCRNAVETDQEPNSPLDTMETALSDRLEQDFEITDPGNSVQTDQKPSVVLTTDAEFHSVD